jgi:hypothetical protein
MSLPKVISTVFLVSFLGMASCTERTGAKPNRKQNLDKEWSFHYGDLDHTSVFEPDNLSDWKAVDLPHDWSMELPFLKKDGGIPVGHTQGGTAWYKKTFTIPQADRNKIHQLYFEGVYMESEVWLNGKKVSFHPYGYTSFRCDITPYCHPAGQENQLAVKVQNEGKNSRWYAGSGIYRHVWLITTERLHLDDWSLFITTPSVTGQKASVRISADVINASGKDEAIKAHIQVKDASGRVVAEDAVDLDMKTGGKKGINREFEIINPALWSVESPFLYTAVVSVRSANRTMDELVTPFGIRSISFSAEDGFLLNGESLKMKGGCVHHDNGLLGVVSIDRAEEKKAELLKANGFNAVRCAHNPPAESFLDACDRLGLLIIDEVFDQWQKQKNPDDYHRYFDEWHEKDLVSMVLRDRNHPSVIMWSIGNEIQERSDSSGVEIAGKLKAVVRRYDTTRPVTAAVNDYWDNSHLNWTASPAAFAPLDVAGYNYMWWEYENDCKLFPERVIYGSETTAMERTVNWDLVEKYPQIIGDFIWTAIDYLGESGIGHAIRYKDGEKEPPQFLDWPWFNAWCGDIDLCGYKKPQAALRDVLWNESKIEMLVHTPVPEGYKEKVSYWGWPDMDKNWNWRGYEGKPLDVVVYTRYPSVRLYLNGQLLEEKETEKDRMKNYSVHFKVNFEPGELKATGVTPEGEKESVSIVTTGEPAKIRLVADRSMLKITENDLSYVRIELLDKEGNIVSGKDIKLELSITGSGKILAAGNACPTDMESFRSMTPKTYKGRALAIIQPAGNRETIVLQVKPQGLEEQRIFIGVE